MFSICLNAIALVEGGRHAPGWMAFTSLQRATPLLSSACSGVSGSKAKLITSCNHELAAASSAGSYLAAAAFWASSLSAVEHFLPTALCGALLVRDEGALLRTLGVVLGWLGRRAEASDDRGHLSCERNICEAGQQVELQQRRVLWIQDLFFSRDPGSLR